MSDQDLAAALADEGWDKAMCDEYIAREHADLRQQVGLLQEVVDAGNEMVADYRKFCSEVGFGDGINEPTPSPADLVDPINDAFSAARDHAECPVICEGCGETLASKICSDCHGSGCLPNPQLAYAECGGCAGAGKVHEACTQDSYADLAAERDRLQERYSDMSRIAAIYKGEADQLRAAVECALAEHDHADTCQSVLSPDAGYPCNCWRAALEGGE